MKQVLAITKRELGALFGSPVAYIVLAVFAVLMSWFFTQGLFVENIASLRSTLAMVPFVMLFILPALAMRSFAEERKTGTIDLLLTLPLKDWQVVLGKYLSLLATWAIALVLVLNLPLTLVKLGDPDVGQLSSAFLAMFLIGAVMLAIGMACSIVTENQVIAFLLAVAVTFALLMIGQPFILMSVGPTLGSILEGMSLQGHFEAMARGVLDLRDIYYVVGVSGFSLAFVHTILSSRSWR